MAQPQFILFVDAARWRLAVRDAVATQWHAVDASAENIEDAAESLVKTLRSRGYTGEPVLIALAADRCMATTLLIDGLPKNDFKARLYRLESHLPVEAEQIVADFGPAGRVDQRECVLAVCADRAWLSKLVTTLEKHQIAVGPIAPAAVLAAQGLHRSKPPDELLILGEAAVANGSLDFLQIRAGRPVRWVTVHPTLEEINTQLEWQSFESQPIGSIEMLGVSRDLSDRLGKMNGWRLNVRTDEPADLAAIAGADVLLARRRLLIDLRRGPLAVRDRWRMNRRAIDAAMISLVIFLMSLTIAFAWRNARYSAAGRSDQLAMESLFHETFPGWTTPANLRAVVESEHRKISAASGLVGEGSALATMHIALRSVPDNATLSLQRLTFTPQHFDIGGESKSYEAADELTAALRGGGLTVASPQARRTAEGRWSFTVQGTVATPAGGSR